jgi:hypothetical protein
MDQPALIFRSTVFAVVVGALVTTGCTGPWSPGRDAEPLAVSHSSAESFSAGTFASDAPGSEQQTFAEKPVQPVTVLTTEQEIALNNLIAEVRKSTSLDPAAEHKLRTDLRSARQVEWPGVVKQFRSSLAYKQQLLARESQQQENSQETEVAAQFSQFPPPRPNRDEVGQALDRLQTAVVHDESLQLASHVEPVQPALAPEPLPIRGTTVANRASEPAATISQISHVQPVAAEPAIVDGKTELATAIAALEREAKSVPGNTVELQDQLRLRMLMLMSGRESDSLAPIPGASPTEQDYWSKQLFALSTYLDAERVPDTKQRAAGALIHLDAARAKLAELATLQVRNLAFVDSVDGYGLYKPHADTKFKPGDQVTLYTEVDNYSSESTKEGYRTTLATSYEVVDLQGRRVDGAQFPEVEDICRNQRRDFHMQYGVTLPTRIYAGEYELRLIITDQLSHKIGQATVRFEIIE